jgi:hypothetical protein
MAPLRCSLVGAVLALCLACGDSTAPALQPSPPPTTVPPPAPPPPGTPTPATMNGFVWGHVVDSTGVCLHGGTVEIVGGPGAGRISRQPDGCDAWDYVGFTFDSLPVGATVTLHASARGHGSEDRQVAVQNGGYPVQFVLLPE